MKAFITILALALSTTASAYCDRYTTCYDEPEVEQVETADQYCDNHNCKTRNYK